MVKRVGQTSFAAVPFDAGRFNLHSQLEDDRTTLAVLVHGLDGEGYETWMDLPARLFAGAEGVDVGVFDYRSGRRSLGRKVDFGHLTRQLHDHLRVAEQDYEDIFLIGHSLGGLVIEDVAKHYLQTRAQAGTPDSGALAALVFVASPRAGSGWAVGPLRWFFEEARVLRRLSNRRSDVQQYFDTHVDINNLAASPAGRVGLAMFAVCGSIDALVSRFSATNGIPEPQCKFVQANHRKIKNPTPDDEHLLNWLRDSVISARLETRAQERRERVHSDKKSHARLAEKSVFVTQLSTDPDGLRWEEIYNEVRDGASNDSVQVVDFRSSTTSQTDLLVTVHDSELVLSRHDNVKTSVSRAREERRPGGAKTVGICPVGAEYEQAETIVKEWLSVLPWPASLYVQGSRDAEGFREVLARFLGLMISNDPRTADYAPRIAGDARGDDGAGYGY